MMALLTSAILFNAEATNHILRQDEIMVGLNGDPTIQFIKITVSDGTQKAWGPGPGETISRAMLVFFNTAGTETGRFLFPNNAPGGANTVLMATTNFAAVPGAPVPDFLIPPLLSPVGGKVCFRGNPANPRAFGVNLCLSYGPIATELTEGGGPAAPLPPIGGEPTSLARFRNFGFGGVNQNGDFALASPTPANTRGQTVTFSIPGPEIHFIPTNVNFGPHDMTLGASTPLSLVITNRGFANSLNISNVTLLTTNPALFTIVSDSGQTVLSPGGTRTLNVTFDPDSPGRKTAALRVVSNDENERIVLVPIEGMGVDPNAPEIDATPDSVSFANRDVTAGATPAVQFAIRNLGNVGALTITNIQVVGPSASQFQLSAPTNASALSPGGTLTVSVAFDPDTAGPKSAFLRIVSGDTDEGELDIPLSGRAFDLNPCTAPNPTNSVAQDIAANAQVLGPGLIFTGTTFGAAADGASSCGLSQTPDVWYRYVAASPGVVAISATGTLFSPTLSVHSSLPGTALNQLACDSSLQRPTSTAQVTFAVATGIPVFLRVAGSSATNSSFQLSLTGPAAFNFDLDENSVTDSCEFDFGDAPAPYPTTLAANGARHRRIASSTLGFRIDSDDDGQPSPTAAGDNEDGSANDEDGIAFFDALVAGGNSTVLVTSTRNDLLNAWLDFNADGDWSDPGEQIITNAPLRGSDEFTFSIPANAAVTNRTFARFRVSSAPDLSFTGEAPNGEVEDHLVEILSPNPTPGQLGVRINEIMAGLNGDSSVQFIELEAADINKGWGPQAGETAGRAMLLFYDQAGRQTGRFVFPSNAPAGGPNVLVATRAFAEQTGLTPDFIMPPEINPVAGKVAFTSNPDNQRFNIHIALSYGGRDYFGPTDGAGPATIVALPIASEANRSLQRVGNVFGGLNRNDAFENRAASPRNTTGATVALQAAPFAEQGRVLFMRETFRGNGRTCATCHVPGRDQFGLTPLTIARLPEDDPLFVFEHNVNRLRLTSHSRPSDLRGNITGTTGTGKVLSGSGDTYLVIGGTNLSGTITDANGNRGSFQSIAEGDLDGPTASNGSERGLEAHNFLEHGRGLILENIDNFRHGEVFRASPHLLNLTMTGPFGLSGEFGDLDVFSEGAVVQHFPKSLARTSGVDFRQPTPDELAAMSAFMFGIAPGTVPRTPSTNSFNLDRFATTEAQKRGRVLFFGDQGRCAKCHSGPVLALSDGSLPGSTADVNENFNTGVANLLGNILDGMPTEPAGLTPGQSTREFNTPSLFNIRLTAPFFHDGSAETLTDAVKFYDSEEFHNSPAGRDVGSLLAANKPELVADLVAFLESLVDLPVEFPRVIDFGTHCPGAPMPGPQTVVITNLGTHTISITNVLLNGTNASAFTILSDTGETNLSSGATRILQVGFAPTNLGPKHATLEFTGVDTNLLGVFSFGVALEGADIDTFVQSSPAALDFGTRDIDAPPSPEMSIVVANDGSIPLDIGGLAVVGPNAGDFVITTQQSPVAPHSGLIIEVSFAPQRAGTKSATLLLPVLACNTDLVEIDLAGVATSTIHHFAWAPFAATQYVGRPFQVRLTAQDRNGDTVESFGGTVRLEPVIVLATPNPGLPPIPNPPLPPVPGTNFFTAASVEAGPLSPARSGLFVRGVWDGNITMLQPFPILTRLMAIDSQSHTGLSGIFIAPFPDDLVLTVVDPPHTNLDGRTITYSLLVNNTGPSVASDVKVTNHLSPDVTFVSASASQGTVAHSGGVVLADLGQLQAGATTTISLQADPNPGATNVINVASVVQSALEAVLTNNVATNSTTIGQFGMLVVRPMTNFMSSGFSGGPFTPTNQIYSLSNAGTAPLTWQVRASGCSLPDGIAGWWPLEGNASDTLGTNAGVLLGNPAFASGLIGQAMDFDGIDDAVRIPAAPGLNVGLGRGITIEAWINPSDVSTQRPVVEWDNVSGTGTHLWIAVDSMGGGSGSLFANIFSIGGTAHHVSSAPNIVSNNAWQHIAMTYNTNSGVATLYHNGNNVQEQNIGSFIPVTTGDLLLGRRAPLSFLGLMDEVSIYSRDLSQAEIQAIAGSGGASKCAAPSIPTSTNCNLPGGLVAWWPLDGNTLDVVGTNHGGLLGNPVFTNGFVGQGMFFDGNNDAVTIPVSPELNVGTNNGFTFEVWLNVPNVARRNPVFQFDNPGEAFSGTFTFVSANTPGSVHFGVIRVGNVDLSFVSDANLVNANTWTHVAVAYSKVTGLGTIYVNGTSVRQQNLGSFDVRTTGVLSLGRRGAAGGEETFQGTLDEASLYNRELSASEVQTVFLAGSGGKCRPRRWFDFAPVSGALAARATTNISVTINTNALGLPVGSYSDILTVTNTSNVRGSTERTVSLAVLNRPPTLGLLSPILMAEDSGLRTVNLNNIRAGGSEQQHLTITAFSANTTLLSNPINVNYASPSTNGTLIFAPLTNAHGTTVVSVVVRDDAGTANGGLNAVTNTFLVTVTPVNDPPVVTMTLNQTIDEGDSLALDNLAADPDLPDDQLTFSLLTGPSGAEVNPATGLLSWTPTENQGPSTNAITIMVSDAGAPSLRATNRFMIVVVEVNSPPVLATAGDRVVHEGMPVTWIAAAGDPDLPANRLAYGLAAGAPAGATVNLLNGSFNWIAKGVPIPSTNTIVYTVSDDGTPVMTDSKTCRIIVLGLPRIVEVSRAGANVVLTWTAIPGLRYRVQSKINLGQPDWNDLAGDVIAAGQTATKTDTLGLQQRFYRIQTVE